VADAVAASSAFPPVLSPMRMAMRNRPVLADGGVYDNLGLDETWKHCRCVLISDGGRQMEPGGRVRTLWLSQMRRILRVIDNQVRELRKRQAISGYELELREGAYWGIRSQIEHYPVEGLLPCPVRSVLEISSTPTRLAKLDGGVQRRLVNWGYAIADAALRSHVDPTLARPSGFPYPEGV
jgi:NTE family protein